MTLVFLTCLSFAIFFKLPTINPAPLISMNNSSLYKDNVLTFKQYIRYAFLQWDNLIYIITSLFLIGLFSVLNERKEREKREGREEQEERKKRDNDDEGWGIVILFRNF